jgi:hypothetical protein
MILTAQPFFNELDLLEIKCRTLEGIVDAHVVVEARTTFTGIPKPLHFAENRARFRQWPIVHVVVDLPQVAETPWVRESAQYKEVLEAVRALNPEIAIWVDADELPRPDSVERFRALNTGTATLEMDHVLFYFDRVDSTQRWRNGKIGFFHPAMVHQPWRGQTHWPIIPDAGWHFEYFGKRDELLAKLAAVSHAPEEGCQNMRRLVSAGELPGLERTVPYPRERLPLFVQQNPGRFAASFSP